MRQTTPQRAPTRWVGRPTVIGLVVVGSALIASLVHPPASSSAPSLDVAHLSGEQRAVPRSTPVALPSLDKVPRGDPGPATEADGVVTEEDGALPDGVTVFDDEHPGVANLDAALREALRDASMAAADDEIELDINSGWRSAAYQDQLLAEAVADYGSRKEAARWVATSATSPHVSGLAVDIGSVDATAWLSKRGAAYGLCQIYRNEAWHFELRPKAIDGGCPRPYADPAHDPRMQP